MTKIDISGSKLYKNKIDKSFKYKKFFFFFQKIKLFIGKYNIRILEKKLILQFRKNFNNFNKICNICLDFINFPIYLHCKHYFHKKCILKWLNSNATCPNCRTNIY